MYNKQVIKEKVRKLVRCRVIREMSIKDNAKACWDVNSNVIRNAGQVLGKTSARGVPLCVA